MITNLIESLTREGVLIIKIGHKREKLKSKKRSLVDSTMNWKIQVSATHRISRVVTTTTREGTGRIDKRIVVKKPGVLKKAL